ncbi:IS3 family transposase [Bifidobacterium pullorum]|uniref:IS3 family transposase n=1 Tax=Bifidobacterium pullorum TaxID=78448 RepID=UPI003F211B60
MPDHIKTGMWSALEKKSPQWLNRFKIMDYKHAYRLVFEYIETFYNTVRIHSHCGYLSPDEYEKHYWKELLKLEQKLAG